MPPLTALRPDRQRWPQTLAVRHQAVLVCDEQGQAGLAADRGPDSLLLQAVEARLQQPLRWWQCSSAQLQHWLAEGEREGRALDALGTAEAAANDGAAVQELSLGTLDRETSPAVRLLDAVLLDALADGASDIHLENTAQGARLRLRIDGVLQPLRQIDGTALAEQLVSRLKVLAELDIGERRLPQDGRFKLRALGREVDFRLSVMPSVWGEDAVIRVLDRQALTGRAGRAGQVGEGGQPAGATPLRLATLGFEPAMCQAIVRLARAPHGLLLVTGPTGSGKTTTLYAAMAELDGTTEKIITIEDPVEYQLPGVVQIPVNEKKGLGFARGLRSILRHDPDRVMVGEIRDAETAQIAVQAALTGHLVFSSVHANSAFDVIARFMHMGLDLYNLVSALNAVLAQRLLRQVCPHCARPVEPDDQALARLGRVQADGRPLQLRAGSGCNHCHHSGLRGRLAVAELLRLDEPLRDLIVARAPMAEIRRAARAGGLRSLADAALDAVRAGRTTLAEVDRVIEF